MEASPSAEKGMTLGEDGHTKKKSCIWRQHWTEPFPKKLKKVFPECLALALGEGDLFPESRQPALGEGTSCLSALSLALGEGPLPRVPIFALEEPFFYFFVFPHFLGLGILFKTPSSNLAYFWIFCYISLVFFLLLEFLVTLQIWTTDKRNYIIWRFKKWYPWYLLYTETVSSNSHEISSILLTWHDEQLTGKVVLNYTKSRQRPKNTKLVGTSCYHM
jgi:hypothetical protein